MSKRQIISALKKKGLSAYLVYERSVPTPAGYAKGWDIFLDEDSQNKLFDIGFTGVLEPDCSTTDAVLEWVNTLPSAP